MTIKEEVIKMIEGLPEDITISDSMAELYFRQNVDAELKELDEEAKKVLKRRGLYVIYEDENAEKSI
jgi:hypothetical protein